MSDVYSRNSQMIKGSFVSNVTFDIREYNSDSEIWPFVFCVVASIDTFTSLLSVVIISMTTNVVFILVRAQEEIKIVELYMDAPLLTDI